MRVVSNTGPLIALAKIRRLDLLSSIYSEVIVPRAVMRELTKGSDWLQIPPLETRPSFRVADWRIPPDPLLTAQLDEGEAAVIRIAMEIGDAEVLIDEKKARRIAAAVYQLKVLGTGGLLLRAKEKKLVVAIKPLLQEIRTNGYYISDRLQNGILRAAGEG